MCVEHGIGFHAVLLGNIFYKDDTIAKAGAHIKRNRGRHNKKDAYFLPMGRQKIKAEVFKLLSPFIPIRTVCIV